MTIKPHQVKRVLRKLALVNTDGYVRSDLYAYTVDKASERIAQELNVPPGRVGDVVSADDLEYPPFAMVVREHGAAERLHVSSETGWVPPLSGMHGQDYRIEYNPDHPEARRRA